MTVFRCKGDPTGVDPAINGDCVRLVGGIGYSRESGRLQWSTPAAVMHGGRPDATPTFESFVELAHLDDRAIGWVPFNDSPTANRSGVTPACVPILSRHTDRVLPLGVFSSHDSVSDVDLAEA
jgi:hypothetical protein